MGTYEVPGMQLMPQNDNMSCWYASARMLVHWKRNRLMMCTPDLVPPSLDAECRRVRDAGTGIVNSQILAMANRLGLKAVPPMSPTMDAIEGWLRDYGPLWVNGKSHIVVIAGVNGMNVKVYDPWPQKRGMINWRSMTNWYVNGANPAGQPGSSRDSSDAVKTVFLHCP